MNDFKSWLPVVANMVVAAFIYGGLFQQVKSLTKSVEKLDSDNDSIRNTVGQHGERISRIEGKGSHRVNGAVAH